MAVVTGAANGQDQKGNLMSFGEVRDFLAKHTRLVGTDRRRRGSVMIAPQWQGRVMTFNLAGLDGPSFGFVCNDFIAAGKHDPHFNNFGGEERMWFSPEGGQFSFWFKPGVAQNLKNWHTPPVLNDDPWTVAPSADASHVRMTAAAKLQNASKTDFHLDVTRDVRLLAAADLGGRFGDAVGRMLRRRASGWWPTKRTIN